ncbi:hypothetical protein E4U37_000661 [Claviceps purpurea]|nr:hypothetical protein E4U37_000661 [Claviceps purpurea]
MSGIWKRIFCRHPWRTEMSNILHEPVDEAVFSKRLHHFHPTQPGQILDTRFKTIAKLGYGGASTVWLAENLKFKRWFHNHSYLPRYVSIKITASDIDGSDEIGWLKLVSNANPSHEGLKYIRTPIDGFDLQGKCGKHSCLVFEPMRETLLEFRQQLPLQRFPLPLFKAYMYFLLQALDYLHTECRLIHTDIKDDNIMVSTLHGSVIKELVELCKADAQPRYIQKEDGRVVYASPAEIGSLLGDPLPRLADFNTCFTRPSGDRCHQGPIQSARYRAPEVLLGIPWSHKVDIWNLGLLMWNLLEDISLFDRPEIAGDDGEYDAHAHLAQIISYIGNPPELLIKRERMFRKISGVCIVNEKSKECKSMNEYWGGPFFDDDGIMIRKDLLKGGKKLPDMVTELMGKDKALFLDFAACMIRWLPEQRMDAKELLKHPFLCHEDEQMKDPGGGWKSIFRRLGAGTPYFVSDQANGVSVIHETTS